jgi:putative addiction module component (TIGR02574 family)
MSTIEELKPSLLALPEGDRLELAEFLFACLEDSAESGHHDVSDEEVSRRIAEVDADPSIMLSQEEFDAHFRKRLGR